MAIILKCGKCGITREGVSANEIGAVKGWYRVYLADDRSRHLEGNSEAYDVCELCIDRVRGFLAKEDNPEVGKICKGCGKPIFGRANKIWCSEACRKKWERKTYPIKTKGR